MPYTTPNTVTGSDTLTAALWNAQIRDNFEDVAKPHSVKAVSAVAVAATSGTAVSWTAADEWDTSSMHNPASNADRIVFPVAGIYSVNGSVSLGGTTAPAGGSLASITLAVRVTLFSSAGASKGDVGTFIAAPLGVGVTLLTINTVAKVAASDYIKVFPFWTGTTQYLNNGSTWSPTANNTNDYITATMVSRTV